MGRHSTSRKEEIFERLFKEHYGELYAYALSFVRDEGEAEDIVSDAFERVWKDWERLDVEESLVPLLHTLVKNRCLDFLRHLQTRERYAHWVKVQDVDEEDCREREMLIQRVMALIEGLPPRTAEVFRKCFLENKSYQEAGNELGISINTVRWHVKSALEILRGTLSREELVLVISILKKVK